MAQVLALDRYNSDTINSQSSALYSSYHLITTRTSFHVVDSVCLLTALCSTALYVVLVFVEVAGWEGEAHAEHPLFFFDARSSRKCVRAVPLQGRLLCPCITEPLDHCTIITVLGGHQRSIARLIDHFQVQRARTRLQYHVQAAGGDVRLMKKGTCKVISNVSLR